MTVAAHDLLAEFGSADPQEARDAIVDLVGRLSFAGFVKNAWPFFHEDESIRWAWYLDCISEHLEATLSGEIVWLFINVPPGFAKSLLCSVFFPAWVWLKKPWYRFLCLSTDDIVTLRDARRMKDLVSSEWYRRVFQPDWTLSRSVAADSNFSTTRHGNRTSRTIRAGITGIRPHYRIVDDANDPTVNNKDKNQAINDWFEDQLVKRAVNRMRSPLVSVQQRTGENDFTGYVLNRSGNPGCVHLMLPNRYEPRRVFTSPLLKRGTDQPWSDERTEPDELLNPYILDQATTDSECENRPQTDEAQNQQNPTPVGGIIFRRDMFNRWSHTPTIDEWRKLPAVPDYEKGYFPSYPARPWEESEYLIIAADLNNLSATQHAKKHTDYAVIDLWGKVGQDRYLYRQVREKLGTSGSAHAIVDLYRLHHRKTAVILIESKANGPTVIATVRALLGIAHEEKLPRTHQIVRDWSVQGEDKRQRAEAVAYVPAAGRVYIPDEREYGEMTYWLAEICGFPNRVRDDRVDTMSMALSFLERGRQFG